ncbi:MAG: type II toxin-antitoxin system RelE/ParE family toxin [Verrucomicrobiales bacterium]|nr:type II toxin-antitoxin system RelE/ParE family toxin [Verrucomicrobiales bacterium]
MKASYDDEAFEEAMDAAAWYETQQEGLVRRFLAEWKKAESRMVADPEINSPFEGDLRKCRFEVFPYTLIYRIVEPDTLQVLAVMHQSRRPGYWKERKKDC